MACSAEATGQAAGICAPVRAGLDPRDGCPIDTAESCGRNGACDGAGSCALYGGGTQCAASFCDASGRFVAARMCGGGACAPAAPEDCGLRICDAASGCRQTCSGDGDCTASGYCDAHTSVCAPKQANGAVCGGAHECATGNCVDGVCCDTACAGVCVSCRAAENGQPADGTCADVIDGTDPENECAAGSASCGLDGFCGHGRCRLAPPNVTCGAPACVNGLGNTSATLTPSAQCDGQGACGAATPVPCPGSVLCLSNQLCRPTICSGDADCISGFYCAAGACTAQQVIGGMCSANDQCVTGVCSAAAHGDGVCCANANSVCGGGCAQGYGLCSTGLSCQPTAWNFDGLLDNSSLPFHWNPDSQSAVFYSTTMNHTPGGIGALGVLAGTPWDAMPNVRLCADDPGNDGVTYIDVGGKRLDAWVLFHGPPTTSSCFFVIEDDPNSPGSFLVLSYVETPLDVWMEMSQLVPLSVSNAVVFGIECKVDDGWPGQLYIDDVSIR
jgi:hypothetical protein